MWRAELCDAICRRLTGVRPSTNLEKRYRFTYGNRFDQSCQRRKGEGIRFVRRCRNRETSKARRERVQEISANCVWAALRIYGSHGRIVIAGKRQARRNHHARNGKVVYRILGRGSEMCARLSILRRQRGAVS